MSDLRIYICKNSPEVNLIGNDLEQDRGLFTSVLISLLTNLSLTGGPGYWGDTISGRQVEDWVGSRLFAIQKNNPASHVRAIQYIKDALQWMIDDNIAASISVVVNKTKAQSAIFKITIKKPSSEELNFLYRKNWDNEQMFIEQIME